MQLLCNDFGVKKNLPDSCRIIAESLQKEERIKSFLVGEEATKMFPF